VPRLTPARAATVAAVTSPAAVSAASTTTPSVGAEIPFGRPAVPCAIHVESLVEQFGEQRTLDDVSVTVCNGELFTLLGPSGSGK
jgi:ABC-type protease/lipase transport system fused ATPase/permease subunit